MIEISVIIPVYNVPLEYLRACFDSLVTQTMQECEFIVVSDGASDVECSICEEYRIKDSRLKFFRRKHAGVSATRNYGIEQAHGKYITFVDSDDWLDENALAILYSLIKHSDADIVLADAEKMWQDGRKERLVNLKKEKKKLKLTNIPAFTVWCYAFRTSVITERNIRFPENLRYSEDRAFIYHYCCFCRCIATTSDVVYFYRQHELSACRNNQSIDHVAQQFMAASLIGDILKKYSVLPPFAICKIKNRIARMGMKIYLKNHSMVVNALSLEKLFCDEVSSSKLNFLYCLVLSKIAAVLESFFKV